MKILCAITLVMLFSSSAATAAESALNETHADWESRVVYDNDEIRFRAATTYAEAGDFVVLAMDRYPKNCDVQFAVMNIVGSTPAADTFTTDTLFGAIRIDEKPIHNMSYTLSLQRGEKVFFVNVSNFDGEDTLLDELRSGQHLRFKLKQGKDEYFLRFSLQGFVAAERRTLTMCRAFNKGKSDEDYFKSEPKKPRTKTKNDKSYF